MAPRTMIKSLGTLPTFLEGLDRYSLVEPLTVVNLEAVVDMFLPEYTTPF